MAFRRYLNEKFIKALNDLYTSDTHNWWKQLVDDSGMFVAVRDGYLNVYSSGGAIAQISWKEERIVLRVHKEYLTQPCTKPYYVELNRGSQHTRRVTSTWTEYARSLEYMSRRISLFVGEERNAENLIACKLRCILDMEVAFGKSPEWEELGPEEPQRRGVRRADFVALNNHDKLVLVEAKLHANKELRAKKTPRICYQLKRYHECAAKQSDQILTAYGNVLRYYEQLGGNFFERRRHPKSAEALLGSLAVDPIPRLLIFGFDKPQKKALPAITRKIETLRYAQPL